MSKDEEGYNGWSNYETWCVNLWLSNDQGIYEAVNELIDGYDEDANVVAIADDIEAFVGELPECASVREQASFVSDLLGAALSVVDWYEIATTWISDRVTA